MRKDFSLNWTKSNSRCTSNPFRFKQVTLACNVFLMVQGLDPNSILHSSVPSREAVDIGFLRYVQNHSTPQTVLEVKISLGFGFFWLCFSCSLMKEKDYVFKNNLGYLSGVITHVYP